MERKDRVIIMNGNVPSPESYPAHTMLRDEDRSANRALARILRHDEESPAGVSPVGAGFLISPCHVITCAHVVNEALGLPANTSTKPEARVTLDFPLAKNNKPVQASVQKWHPVREDTCPGLIEDVALLEIKATEVPEGGRPLSFVKLAERDIFDLEVRMFGFPVGYDNGLWSFGTIRGETGEGWYQIDHHPGYHVVTPGFSGAPALDKQGCAVGMIVCRRHLEEKITAYIIPGSTIKWYLRDFWGCAEWPDDMPQFLIFLNLVYTVSRDASIIKRMLWLNPFLSGGLRGIQKALARIRKSVGESCLLFDALDPVESNDVRRWFYDNMIKIDESEIIKLIRCL